ncbi:hypothetical protein MTO98_26180 [Mucilaginibacter sp. SMC90]|uniref:hypothetical protein n=1 Tax=Mucilaginibacter sp. SMC90 TaxID=2929803 RepID=UPI001FB2CD26|nr:hypothetical protein [Mucilaginibacter sp. SMC90]UOE47903.1 hypothetical protein MTO98_26180 [Mucilaginibacter sp. SMC90]
MNKNPIIMSLLVISIIALSCGKQEATTISKPDTQKQVGGATDTTISATDTTDTHFYIKFKADTTTYKFTALVQGNFNKKDASGNFDFSFSGQANSLEPGTSRLIVVGVNKDSLVTGKYYQNFGAKTDTTAKANLVQLTWYNSKNQLFSSYGKEFGADLLADTRIKFTQITTYRMMGTFSGTLYLGVSANSEKHTLTNGEFYIQRIK